MADPLSSLFTQDDLPLDLAEQDDFQLLSNVNSFVCKLRWAYNLRLINKSTKWNRIGAPHHVLSRSRLSETSVTLKIYWSINMTWSIECSND